MNFVLTLNIRQIDVILDFYKAYITTYREGSVIARIKDEGLTITIYTSHKVMFQGKRAEEVFFYWHDMLGLEPPEPSKKEEEKDKDTPDFYHPSIGSDESGVGDYFGPLTVAAAYVDKTHIEKLRKLKIQDSKTLSDDVIRSIAPKVMKIVPHSLLTLPNKKYNTLIKKGYNANSLKAYLHATAQKNVIDKLGRRPDVIIDQFSEKKTYLRYLQSFKDPVVPDIFKIRAEALYASVAIASIIARYAFLLKLERLSKKIDVTLLKGAGKKVDIQARTIIDTFGEGMLNNIAKTHFKTTEKAKNL
ncbi:MAG: ribonuclease HIII [Bacillota bacterium]